MVARVDVYAPLNMLLGVILIIMGVTMNTSLYQSKLDVHLHCLVHCSGYVPLAT